MSFNYIVPRAANGDQRRDKKHDQYLLVFTIDVNDERKILDAARDAMESATKTCCDLVGPIEFSEAGPGTPRGRLKKLIEENVALPEGFPRSFVACASPAELEGGRDFFYEPLDCSRLSEDQIGGIIKAAIARESDSTQGSGGKNAVAQALITGAAQGVGREAGKQFFDYIKDVLMDFFNNGS